MPFVLFPGLQWPNPVLLWQRLGSKTPTSSPTPAPSVKRKPPGIEEVEGGLCLLCFCYLPTRETIDAAEVAGAKEIVFGSRSRGATEVADAGDPQETGTADAGFAEKEAYWFGLP